MAEIFIKVLNMSITAGWLIVAVLILRLIFKKAPRYIICMMWLLVGLRLALPVSFESALSLVPSSKAFDSEAVDNRDYNVNTVIEVVDKSVNDYSGKYYEEVTVEPGFKRYAVSVAACVWFVGMTGLLIYAVVSYMRLKKKVQTAILFRDNIRQSEFVKSPFVLGIIKPVIYVPYDIENADMDYIIAHESTHIRRGDHIVKMVGFALLSVYWFNPLVWIAYILLCRDIELACDEKVIKGLDEDSRKAYSSVLLNCAISGSRRHIISACPVAFGEIGVKARIKSIMNYRKPGLYIAIAAFAVLAVVAVCFMTDPVVKNQEDGNKIYEEFTYNGVAENGNPYIEAYRFNKKYFLEVKDKNGLNPVIEVIGLPCITLDTENKKFHFFYDALSSYLIFGSYVIEDELIIATTDDGLYTYRFKMDGDKLIFIKEGSSTIRITDSKNLGYTIEDGSVFTSDLAIVYSGY